jgi:hypothetical protein
MIRVEKAGCCCCKTDAIQIIPMDKINSTLAVHPLISCTGAVDAEAQVGELRGLLLSVATQPKQLAIEREAGEGAGSDSDGGDRGNLKYNVSFDQGALGLQLTSNLVVKELDEGMQAQKSGVCVGSTIIAVAGVTAANMSELQAIMVIIKQTKR